METSAAKVSFSSAVRGSSTTSSSVEVCGLGGYAVSIEDNRSRAPSRSSLECLLCDLVSEIARHFVGTE